MFIVGDFPEHIGQNELIRTQICAQGSRTNPLVFRVVKQVFKKVHTILVSDLSTKVCKALQLR
jgi:hypothetical protein